MFLSDILGWWYGAGFKDLIARFKVVFEGTADFFSIDILAKSLFQPFRQTLTDVRYKRTLGQKIGDALVSRSVGFITRFFIILIGALLMILELMAFGLVLLLWPFVPFLPVVFILMTIFKVGFAFKEESTPGVDYILPNTQYLEERKHKIKGVLITHGHLDHIGAIPYLIERLGNPKIYARNFTALMIKKRQEEFPHLKPLNIEVVEEATQLKLGKLDISFFAVTHSIPDSMGIMIDTPHGKIVHTGDLRLDHMDNIPSQFEEEIYARFKTEKVLLLLADSTNSENPGFSISDRVVMANIERIIRRDKNRTRRTQISTN
jgi:hypothetical protein